MAKTSSRKAPASSKKAARGAPPKRSADAKKGAGDVKKNAAPPAEPVFEPVFEPVPARLAEPPPEPAPASPPEMKALPAGEPVESPAFPFEIDPKRLEEGLRKLREELVHWTNKGRYTKVRFKFRGKQLLPDIPIAAVAAAEGLTFYWGGILRALVFTVAGGSLLQVELINDADKQVQAGKEALLAGELDEALALFQQALAMDRDNAGGHLNMGVALKLKGDKAGALVSFERARALDPDGPLGAEAERLAAPLRPKDVMGQTG